MKGGGEGEEHAKDPDGKDAGPNPDLGRLRLQRTHDGSPLKGKIGEKFWFRFFINLSL